MPIYKGELVSQNRLALLQSLDRAKVSKVEKSPSSVPMRWDNTVGKAIPLSEYLLAKKSAKAAHAAAKEAAKEASRLEREVEKALRRKRELEKQQRKLLEAKRRKSIARMKRAIRLASMGHIGPASHNFAIRREWEQFIASICIGRKLHSAGREWEGHEAPQWPSPIATGPFAKIAAMDAAYDHTGQGVPVWIEYPQGSVRLHKAVEGTYNCTSSEVDFAHVA